MYDLNSIRKEMDKVAKSVAVDAETLFAPLLVAKTILTTKTPQDEEYDKWVKSLTDLVKQTDEKTHLIIYRILAVLHFKYKHQMEKEGTYEPMDIIRAIGLEKAAYYYHFEHPDMRKQVFADFGVSDTEALSIVRMKMDVLKSIMNNSTSDRDRVSASKELTKYIDCMMVPSKVGNTFIGRNLQIDNSDRKTVNNQLINFSELPGMDDPEVRRELSTHAVTTIDQNGEILDE